MSLLVAYVLKEERRVQVHDFGQMQRPQVLFDVGLVVHGVHPDALPARNDHQGHVGGQSSVAQVLALGQLMWFARGGKGRWGLSGCGAFVAKRQWIDQARDSSSTANTHTSVPSWSENVTKNSASTPAIARSRKGRSSKFPCSTSTPLAAQACIVSCDRLIKDHDERSKQQQQ